MAKLFMGIDLGTSGTKTIVVDMQGQTIASAAAEYPLLTPKPGWTEQHPEDWWEAARKTIRQVLANPDITPRDIAAIGFSGQMHGSVFLDQKGAVVRPCLLWNDGRTAKVCDEITQRIGAKQLHQWVSNPMLTGFTLPKIVWLQQTEPSKFKRVRHVMLPKDYLRYRLTGELATEVSDAAGTVCFDVRHRRWSKPLLEALEIPADLLPPVHESHAVTGTVTSEAARETGLVVGTPVVGGAADQPAGAVGTGVVCEGQVMCSLGTSGTVVAAMARPRVDRQERLHTFSHAVPNTWYMMGCTLSAGGSLAWYRDQFAELEREEAEGQGVDVYELLMAQAETVPPGCHGLAFLPYLTGERSPHKDPYARGAFVGLSVQTGRAEMVRAIIEGVSFSLRDCLEIVRKQKVAPVEIRLTGGGARSPFWRQLLADVFQTPIALVSSGEGPALGGAILASVGAGAFANTLEACETMIKVTQRVRPRKRQATRYDEVYETWKQLYPALKQSFHRAVDLGA